MSKKYVIVYRDAHGALHAYSEVYYAIADAKVDMRRYMARGIECSIYTIIFAYDE